MLKRSFWDGLAIGAAVGMIFGVLMLSRRKRMGPMERTKVLVGRTARQALRRAQGTIGRMAGRFAD